MQEVMSTLLREEISLVAAGRTDTGVHARQMYAHFDVAEPLTDLMDIRFRLNAFLPADIAVQDILEVPSDAHARFDATERTYEYWILRQKDPFLHDYAHYVHSELNMASMNDAAAHILGKQDFKSFSRSNTDVKTFICDVREAKWEQKESKMVFTISADRFLRNMVRAVVGTLLEVGSGKRQAGDVNTIIKSRDRQLAGPSVPAKGLYLTRVEYPERILNPNG